jgi:hypothetical protein
MALQVPDRAKRYCSSISQPHLHNYCDRDRRDKILIGLASFLPQARDQQRDVLQVEGQVWWPRRIRSSAPQGSCRREAPDQPVDNICSLILRRWAPNAETHARAISGTTLSFGSATTVSSSLKPSRPTGATIPNSASWARFAFDHRGLLTDEQMARAVIMASGHVSRIFSWVDR